MRNGNGNLYTTKLPSKFALLYTSYVTQDVNWTACVLMQGRKE